MFFRGVLFHIIEERPGTWIALAPTALIFMTNPNATLFSSFAIAMKAGILLGADYLLTRRLWLTVGIHFAWNFAQGTIFGVRVSRFTMDGLLESDLNGRTLLSAGEFRADASISRWCSRWESGSGSWSGPAARATSSRRSGGGRRRRFGRPRARTPGRGIWNLDQIDALEVVNPQARTIPIGRSHTLCVCYM